LTPGAAFGTISRQKDMRKPKGIPELLEEPLLHFLIIGAALFLLFDWRGGRASAPGGAAGGSTAQSLVTRDDLQRMDGQFEKTWQRPPDEAERKALLEDFVRNEILFREALAAGLDRDDEVLKRRLRQKMEFIYEDVSSWAEPADADLAAFMLANREKYLADPRLSFRQVYFNPERRGGRIDADAGEALARLARGADPYTVGDPTLLEREVPLAPLWEIRKRFGDEFARSLLALKPGRWEGPVRSGFGEHLVFVVERRDGRMPELGEVREAVKRDWTAAKQKELKDAAYARIRQRYTVTVERPRAPAGAAPPAAGGAATR
jgi:hypothetical protein